MKVTIIDSDVTYPPTSGKRLRTLGLLLPLARDHELTMIGRSETGDTREAEAYLGDHGIKAHFVHAQLVPATGAKFATHFVRSLFASTPFNVQNHRFAAMRDAVQANARNARPDVWQIEWSGYDYCLDDGQGPTVIQAHNVDALIWKRYVETETNPVRKAVLWDQYRRMLSHERHSFTRATRVVAVCEEDAGLARKLYGEFPVDVIPNGVDVGKFGAIEREPPSHNILFLGALDWRPNTDAIDMLLDRIWPELKARSGPVRLRIVGRNPAPGLRDRIALLDGVELHADVPDVRPYLASAAALAVPLRIGGGSRLKILEALASGLPVVSSAVGAEGLNLTPGTHFRLAESPGEFATALRRAIDEPAAESVLAENGRAFVAAHHDWPALARRLERTWEAALSSPASSTRRRVA